MTKQGFSLLELIVDIAILATLLVLVYLLVDPLSQLKKASDASKKHDLTQIQNALDTYYNDTGCYPESIPFGNIWKVDNTTYMKKVPQTAECKNNPSECFMYQVDSSTSSPQWNILYINQDSVHVNSCALSSLSQSCVPPNYDQKWACAFSGSIDCDFVSSNHVIGSDYDGDTSSGESDSVSSPSTELCPASERRYACTGGPVSRCNVVPQGSGTYCAADCEGAC